MSTMVDESEEFVYEKIDLETSMIEMNDINGESIVTTEQVSIESFTKLDSSDAELVEKKEDMTLEEKQKLSAEFKEQGNVFFKLKKYTEAIDFYSQAIETLPTAVFYGNRAACYFYLSQYDQVISDCTDAIAMDEKYSKAHLRRAQAHMKLANNEGALMDYTTLCILSNFQDDYMKESEQLLKTIAQKKAPEFLEREKKHFPSLSFFKTYFESYKRTRTEYKELVNMQTLNSAEEELIKSIKQANECEFEVSLATLKALSSDQVESMSEVCRLLYFNLYGTYLYILGDREATSVMFDKVLAINPNDVDTLTKKAALALDIPDFAAAIALYEKAAVVDASHSDVYYHRGQLKFITGDCANAIADYEKVMALEPDHLYAFIQKAVSEFKAGDIGQSTKTFMKATRRFPNRAEVYLYHGEMMVEQGKFDDALTLFDKATEIDPASPLPYVNRGILYAQFKMDISGGEMMLRQALEKDEACEIAYLQLGSILMAGNKIQAAIELYDKALEYAKSATDVINFLMMKEAALAQQYVAKVF